MPPRIRQRNFGDAFSPVTQPMELLQNFFTQGPAVLFGDQDVTDDHEVEVEETKEEVEDEPKGIKVPEKSEAKTETVEGK